MFFSDMVSWFLSPGVPSSGETINYDAENRQTCFTRMTAKDNGGVSQRLVLTSW
jgi:hypothetical protein